MEWEWPSIKDIMSYPKALRGQSNKHDFQAGYRAAAARQAEEIRLAREAAWAEQYTGSNVYPEPAEPFVGPVPPPPADWQPQATGEAGGSYPEIAFMPGIGEVPLAMHLGKAAVGAATRAGGRAFAKHMGQTAARMPAQRASREVARPVAGGLETRGVSTSAQPMPRPAPGTRVKSTGPGVRKLTDAEKELMRENAERYRREAAGRGAAESSERVAPARVPQGGLETRGVRARSENRLIEEGGPGWVSEEAWLMDPRNPANMQYRRTEARRLRRGRKHIPEPDFMAHAARRGAAESSERVAGAADIIPITRVGPKQLGRERVAGVRQRAKDVEEAAGNLQYSAQQLNPQSEVSKHLREGMAPQLNKQDVLRHGVQTGPGARGLTSGQRQPIDQFLKQKVFLHEMELKAAAEGRGLSGISASKASDQLRKLEQLMQRGMSVDDMLYIWKYKEIP